MIKKLLVTTLMLLMFYSVSFAASLSWELIPGEEITGFRIYYGKDIQDLQLYDEVSDSTQEYSFDKFQLVPLEEYYFAISAYNSAGESDLSNSVSYISGETTPPTPPTGLKIEK